MNAPLLEVNDLDVRFHLSERTIHAVNGVTFSVNPGQVVGIVGESACGKSVTSLAIMRLIQEPGRIEGGQVLLHSDNDTVDLLTLSRSAMEHVRGNRISMIFQDPMTSLNPVLTIGYQLMEPLKLHRGLSPTRPALKPSICWIGLGFPSPKVVSRNTRTSTRVASPTRDDRDGCGLFA